MPAADSLRFEAVLAEPGRFWIRYAPRAWPGPDREWLDLARGRLTATALGGEIGLQGELPGSEDVVYLPPVEPASALARQRWAESCAQRGYPVVLQVMPDEAVPAVSGTVVLDLSPELLRGRGEAIACPAGVWCLWPLVPGLTDAPSLVARGLERLASCGAAGVRPVVPELAPETRRRLARYGGVASYRQLFHRNDAGERRFMRAAVRRGLAVQAPRPEVAAPPGHPNRVLTTHFLVLADLWLACGRSEGRAQEYFRVARRLEEEGVDVSELARRGGLRTVTWLDDEMRGEIRRLATQGTRTDLHTALLAELGAAEEQ